MLLVDKIQKLQSSKNRRSNHFLQILERDRGDEMTDNEVLSQAMAWRREGGVARKGKKAGKITDFTNCNDWSKPGPRKRF